MARLLAQFGAVALVLALGAAGFLARTSDPPQEEPPTRRAFEVVARRYQFTPTRIEVNEGDVVRIRLTAADVPHSFTIDEYRIAKRIVPGSVVTVEFQATLPGTFAFYCNLTVDDGCRQMRGELVVRDR